MNDNPNYYYLNSRSLDGYLCENLGKKKEIDFAGKQPLFDEESLFEGIKCNNFLLTPEAEVDNGIGFVPVSELDFNLIDTEDFFKNDFKEPELDIKREVIKEEPEEEILGKRKRIKEDTSQKRRKIKKQCLTEKFLFSPNQDDLAMAFEDIVEKKENGKSFEYSIDNTVGSVSINGVDFPNINIHHIKEIRFSFGKKVVVKDVKVEAVYDVNPMDNLICTESKVVEVNLKGTNVFPLRPAHSFVRLFQNHPKLKKSKEFAMLKKQKKIKKMLNTPRLRKKLLRLANPEEMTLESLMTYFTNQYDILHLIQKGKYLELKKIPVLACIMNNVDRVSIIVKVMHILLKKYKKKMDTKNDVVTKTCVLYRKMIVKRVLKILRKKLEEYTFSKEDETDINEILNQKCFVSWKENSFTAKVNSRKKTRCLKQVNFIVTVEKAGEETEAILPITFSQYNQKTENTNYLDENGYYSDIGVVKGIAYERRANVGAIKFEESIVKSEKEKEVKEEELVFVKKENLYDQKYENAIKEMNDLIEQNRQLPEERFVSWTSEFAGNSPYDDFCI